MGFCERTAIIGALGRDPPPRNIHPPPRIPELFFHYVFFFLNNEKRIKIIINI